MYPGWGPGTEMDIKGKPKISENEIDVSWK